ncbi:hypothetical protein FRC17_003323 [Serendipita sp. 399]|nr:hypothetical protein FRC17_003323 [Serendipita sp. 399]
MHGLDANQQEQGSDALELILIAFVALTDQTTENIEPTTSAEDQQATTEEKIERYKEEEKRVTHVSLNRSIMF